MTDWLNLIFWTVVYILPAYVANSAPVLFGKDGTPLDFHKTWIDHKRILGDGKTIQGSLGGIFSGIVTGVIIGYLMNNIGLYATLGVALSVGCVLGDILKSFLKRRAGIETGAELVLIDSWDFLVGAVLLGYFILPITLEQFLILLVITPIIHRVANVFAHWIRIKRVPW